MTSHAGLPSLRPAGYPAGHRPAHRAPRCPIIAAVTLPDSDRLALLVCDLTAGHPGDFHYDETDGITWQQTPALPPAP